MIESLKQLSPQQLKSQLMRSYILLNETKKQEEKAQNTLTNSSQKIKSARLELIQDQIKLFEYQQSQNYFSLNQHQSVFCRQSPHRKALFLCCSQDCDKHAIMCGEQCCKCSLDHQKCSFAAIEPFINQILNKLSEPIPKQIQDYFQVKSFIYEYMINRISQQRQSLRDWQQDFCVESQKSLFLYGFNLKQAIFCFSPKVAYHQKPSQDHQKCGCFPLQIKLNKLQHDRNSTKTNETIEKIQVIKAICNEAQKKYSLIINYFDQKIDKLLYHKECANLNSVQLLIVDFLQNKNNFCKKASEKEAVLQRQINIIPGSAIYLARKFRKNKSNNLDLQKFAVSRIRKIWKCYAEKLFRLFIEGKAMNELFRQMSKAEYLQCHPIQELKSYIDKITQSLSQGQKQLFSDSIFKTIINLQNLDPKQLKDKLKKCKGTKADQVYINNDKLTAAINEVETTIELGNLTNATKLQIKWCLQMIPQVSMEILNVMSNLKQLTLLDHTPMLSQNFINKLCSFKQLKSFYINYHSHPKYYRSFTQDYGFIAQINQRDQNDVLSIEKSLQLSKLPELENIQIGQTYHEDSAQVIQNMKKLKHITLGYDFRNDDGVDANLMKKICQQTDLRTLSLVGLYFQDSNQINQIITKNPHLSTIIIRNQDDKNYVDDETIECMTKLIRLQTLCISKNRVITGHYLSKLNSLVVLDISVCPNISLKQIKQSFNNMHHLQHLKLNCNYWVDDELMRSIKQCKKLTYLDISSTSVTGQVVKHLKGLTRLNVLICGQTRIKANNLIELAKYVPNIKKLGLFWLNLNDDQLFEITKSYEKVTHLDIRLNNITEQAIAKIQQLKAVVKTLLQDS